MQLGSMATNRWAGSTGRIICSYMDTSCYHLVQAAAVGMAVCCGCENSSRTALTDVCVIVLPTIGLLAAIALVMPSCLQVQHAIQGAGPGLDHEAQHSV
jgi:hypothetical protein